ncbi:MAG: CopG family transcriptional regulator [Candidatus Aminicenantes bacterium RBG_13_59_9]|nr:MAG: CopG family transcriptional regulator [Candidatus Aminicenantes bacterium RBG_13_59_9]
MVRTQIQLTESQARALKKLAAERGVSMAELIRQGADALLRSKPLRDDEEMRKRALALAGKYRSGKRDISKDHDRYLAEEFEK